MNIDKIMDSYYDYEDLMQAAIKAQKRTVGYINEFLDDPANKNRLVISGDNELLGNMKSETPLLNVEIIGKVEGNWEVEINDFIFSFTPYQMLRIIKDTDDYDRHI